MSSSKNHAKTGSFLTSEQDDTALLGQKTPCFSGHATHAANDSLYNELEMRYGGGFAQWIIDGLKKKHA